VKLTSKVVELKTFVRPLLSERQLDAVFLQEREPTGIAQFWPVRVCDSGYS